MILKFTLPLLLLFNSTLSAQDMRVTLVEQKKGKRTVLFAENHTADTLNVFLMVISEGYRRSADRPVIKNVPPMDKVPMITLIELTTVPSSYSYELIVNDQENDLNFTLVNKEKDIEKVIKDRLVIFSMNDCEKCDALSNKLESLDIYHRVFNIHDDPLLYIQFMAFIEKELTQETKILFPVIWNKDHTVFGYSDLEEIMTKLQ